MRHLKKERADEIQAIILFVSNAMKNICLISYDRLLKTINYLQILVLF